jgi:CHAD domain-containing protein
MNYELRRNENLGDGLRRICRKQVDLALAFARGEKETDDTPVHETRKRLKKARAALALVKKEIGLGLFKRQDHCLRDVGRTISEVRDAEVRLQTIRQLQGLARNRKPRKYAKLEDMLVLELESFVAAFAEWQVQAVPNLEKMLSEIEAWPVDEFDSGQLCRAIQRTYKRSRKALAQAKAKRTPESFHDFRSVAKQLGYQLRIIRPAHPVVLENFGTELRSLGDLLGRAHDLTFLGDRLRQEEGASPFATESHELLAVIEASASDLQFGAADLAERFFSERPRDFGKRVAGWLADWPDNHSRSIARKLVNDSGRVAATV